MARHRTIYVRNEEMWSKAKEHAKLEGLSLSAVIERELRIWVRKHKTMNKNEFRNEFLTAQDQARRMDPDAIAEELALGNWLIRVQKMIAGYNEGAFTMQEVFDNVITAAVETDYAQVDALTGETLKGWDAVAK